MTEKAQLLSLEAGSKVAGAMKDVIYAAAGITGFAVESARDLVQYMVRRGQMRSEEADRLMREVEEANAKRGPSKLPTRADLEARQAAARAAAAPPPPVAAATVPPVSNGPRPTPVATPVVAAPAAAAPAPAPAAKVAKPAAKAPAKSAKAPARTAAKSAHRAPPAKKSAAKKAAKKR